jgi:hypothetical protein
MYTYWIRTARRVTFRELDSNCNLTDSVASSGQIRWAAGADPTPEEIINLERCTTVLIERLGAEKNQDGPTPICAHGGGQGMI